MPRGMTNLQLVQRTGSFQFGVSANLLLTRVILEALKTGVKNVDNLPECLEHSNRVRNGRKGMRIGCLYVLHSIIREATH